MRRQAASAIVMRLDRVPKDDKPDLIRLTMDALEATLPEGDVQLAGAFTNPRTIEAVYSWPSQAIYVVQGLQTAVRHLRFRAAVAFGAHWTDLIRVGGSEVAPHALTVARALATRLNPRDHVWMAFQGYGAWDQVATAAFSVTCNIRSRRSMWQRQAEDAYRVDAHVTRTADRIGVRRRAAGLRLKRGHVREVDYLDDTLARQLDAVASQQVV